MTTERLKDQNKVKAGQARQRQLREQLGEQGYADYQKAQYAATLAAHPDFHALGAIAANAAQLIAWGVDGYIDQRKSTYRACCDKYGVEFARNVVRAARICGLSRRSVTAKIAEYGIDRLAFKEP